MKYLKNILLIALLLLPFSLMAIVEEPQNRDTDANITGHVTSASTNEHLPYVNVVIKGTNIATMSDGTGHFFLKNLPIGEVTVEVSMIGFKPSAKTITTVKNKLIEVNFTLEEAAYNIGEVVVSATRNETDRRSAPVIVNIASAKLFEGTASTMLSESMNFQPGLRIDNNCGNCSTVELKINGLPGEYSQILMDSRPIFSSLSSVYALDQLPLTMVERVEVIRGGGSALFGSSAIGGVVNIITKEPLRNSIILSNTTNFLKGGSTDINTTINGSFVSDDHKAGVYIFGMVKDRDPFDRNEDGFSDLPKIESETVGFRGYYRTTDYSKITAEYHHIREFRRGGNNFNLPPHEADVAEELNHTIDGGGLSYDWYTPDYKHRFSLYSSAQAIKRKSYFGVEKDLDAYGYTNDITFIGGGQYTLNLKHFLFMPSEITTGVEYNFNELDDYFERIDRNMQQTIHITGAFLQNEWKSDKFSLLIGARLDKHNLMDNAVFSPRANIRYTPSDRVGFRASYSSGYRAPQAYSEDLHIEAVGGMLAHIELADNLKPEYSHSVNISADINYNFGATQTNLLIEAFHTSLDDIFTLEETLVDEQEGIIYLTRRNGNGAKVMGVNLEGRVLIRGKFDVQMGYTQQSSRYNEPEKWTEELAPQRRIFRSPDSFGYVTSNIEVSPKFQVSLFGNYTGSMLVKHVKVTENSDTRLEKTTPHFWDFGTKLTYKVPISSVINLELNGGVKNIFDAFQKDLDYGPLKDPSYIYGPSFPRIFFVGLRFLM